MVCNSSLFASACKSVGVGGDPRDWCRNRTYIPGVDVSRMCVMFAMVGVGISPGVFVGDVRLVCVLLSGIIHSPVFVHLCAQIIVFPRCLMVHPILVKVTSHPALQRLTTDRSECDARFGSTCACRACLGNWSRCSVHVCVVHILSPLGSLARIGVAVGCMLSNGAVAVRK